MKPIRLTTKQFCRVTGIPLGSINAFRAASGIEPDHGIVRAQNAQEPWSMPNVISASVWRGLRRMGVQPEYAAAVARYLWRLSFEELEARLQNEQRYILVIGPIACPYLLSREAIHWPEGFTPELAASLKPVTAVDVKKLYEAIVREVEQEVSLA